MHSRQRGGEVGVFGSCVKIVSLWTFEEIPVRCMQDMKNCVLRYSISYSNI